MSIQGNINQIWSLSALLRSQNPETKRKAELYQANKYKQNLEKIEGEALEGYTEAINTPLEDIKKQTWDTARQMETEVHRRITELDPTLGNVRGLVYRQQAEADQAEADENEILTKQNKAKQSAAKAQMAEAQRLAESRMLDLSKLDERTIGKVERAYRHAERDTKYLSKKEETK